MLNSTHKERLLKNWGQKADSMACNVEVRVYDPLSSWECFIYAMNPEDEDEIACILNGFEVEVCNWRLSEIASHFNAHGEAPEVDNEFRPKRAAELFKQLNEVKS